MLLVQPPGTMATNFLFFGCLFAVLYFVFLRPGARRPRVGEEVVTDAGFVGRLKAIEGDHGIVELANEVRLTCRLSSLRAL